MTPYAATIAARIDAEFGDRPEQLTPPVALISAINALVPGLILAAERDDEGLVAGIGIFEQRALHPPGGRTVARAWLAIRELNRRLALQAASGKQSVDDIDRMVEGE